MIEKFAVVIVTLLMSATCALAQVRSYNLLGDTNEQEIERRLNQRIDFEFIETPLADLTKQISEISGIPIWVSKNDLDEAGLGTDVPVTFGSKGCRIRDGLRLILDDLQLTWTIKHGHLVIIDSMQRPMTTRVYDVRHLVEPERIPVYWKGRSGVTEVTYRYWCDFAWLVELITTSVEPTTWDEVGGPGSISPYWNRQFRTLTVTQSYQAHAQIAQLLREVEKVRLTEPLPFAPTIVSPAPQDVPRSTDPRLRRPTRIRSSQLRTTGQ